MSFEKDLYKLAESLAGSVAKVMPGRQQPQQEKQIEIEKKIELEKATAKEEEEREAAFFKRDVSDEQIHKEILRFKMQVLKAMPFYGDVMMHLQFIEDKSVPTAATNGLVVYYNPDFLRTQSMGQMNYILMHEVMHIILLHPKRSPDRDPKIWNIACDLVVNHMNDRLKSVMDDQKIAFDRPVNGCFMSLYMGESADELYKALLKTAVRDSKGNVVLVRIPAGFGGRTKEVKLDNPDLMEVTKEDGMLVGMPDADLETIQKQFESQINDILRNAYSSAGLNGSGEYYMPDQVLELVKTKPLPWKKLLMKYMDTEISDESSYFTPERKYIHMDLLIPGPERTEETLGAVWAFVDSSGSIDQEDLNKFLTQLYYLTRDCSCELNIAYWDTNVTEVYKKIKKKENLLKALPKHSGGTDINCVYKYINENKIKPLVMLILTDGFYGSVKTFPELKKLSKKTIVVLSQDRYVPPDINKTGRYTVL